MMTAMKKIALIPLSLLAFAAFPRQAAPQDNFRKETIVRNDTITQTDTIITTKKIKRTEVIQRMEEVFYADSVALLYGRAPSKTVLVSGGESGSEGNLPVVVMHSLPGGQIGAVPAEAPVAEALTPAQVPLPVAPGGDYIWIPDSLKSDIALLLNGGRPTAAIKTDTVYVDRIIHANAGENFAEIPEDPNEKVTFRGDTVNMVLRSRNLGRFDRGLFNYLYIPKGVWSIGVTASYGEFSTKDLEVLDLISDIDFSGHLFSIRPYFSYFIRNNSSVGMRLGYTSGKASIGSFKVDIDEDMNFNLHDISYRSETYTAAITYSQYFGITRRGRFSIFNDVELAFSSGNSDFRRPYNGELKNTHTNTMEVALNFSPGLSIYIMDPVTFNISFGVFGVSLRNEKQNVDGVDMGNRFTSGANFRFNIFNINFGVAVNL